MPVLLTAIKELNEPRYPSVKGIYKGYETLKDEEIKVLTLADLDIDTTQIGLKGSPTNVYRSFVPVKSKESQIMNGKDKKEESNTLMSALHSLNLI